MNEQKTRNKIIDTLRQSGYGYFLTHKNVNVEKALENAADAFIAENIGDTSELFGKIEQLEAENAELRARLDKAVELPCKVGDKVYGVGFTDCDDRHTTDPKRKREIFNKCVKMNGNCEKCKYSRPAIEEFFCTHIQIGRNGIEGSNILVVGEREDNYTENNVFLTRSAAEARLAELKGEKQGEKE